MINQIATQINQFNQKNIILPIDKLALEEAIELLFNTLFPICKKTLETECDNHLTRIYNILKQNIQQIEANYPLTQLDDFFDKLPLIQEKLYLDAQSFYKNDPAAQSISEVILSYPGFYALTVHRLAHELYQMKFPLIPRLWSEYAHSKGGIDIHPGATIGTGFFLDHGTGTVIGETCIIGNEVKIYQNVTLGALHITKDLQDTKRHPTVEDRVVIYAGATILGGTTIIGHDSTIGGNVFITKSIEPYSLVYYNSEMKKRTLNNFDEAINFVI